MMALLEVARLILMGIFEALTPGLPLSSEQTPLWAAAPAMAAVTVLMYLSAAAPARPDDISELVRVGLLKALEFVEPWMVGATISLVVAVIPGLMLYFREAEKHMRRAGYM